MSTTPTIGRRVAAFFVVLVTIVGVSLLSVGSASAAPVASQTVITTDGCTLVPPAPSGVDFTPACNQHDICYGTQTGTRLECDRAFLKNMLDLCPHWSINSASCIGWAYTYYLGVRIFGLYFWNAANPAVRVQTPLQG